MAKRISGILKIPSHVRMIRSLSVDPFYNLALEDRIFQNNDFNQHPVILFGQNSPSVFIGRFQNPWKEANVSFLKKSGVSLLRRYSGGGTVFHDLGNCNITVFSRREFFTRNMNLEIVCNVLRKHFSLPCIVTKKLDIIYQGFKVSGTAARIIRDKAYHHFTLLLSSDLLTLKACLQSPLSSSISTTATASTHSDTINLSSVNPRLDPESFYKAFCNEILGSEAHTMDIPADISEIEAESRARSWDWVFSNSPKFTLTLPDASIELTIEKGFISRLEGKFAELFQPLLDTRLTSNEFTPKLLSLQQKHTDADIRDSLNCFNILVQNLPEN